MSGLEKYDAPAKAEWRLWAWKELASRTTVPIHETVVMYLAGPEPKDAEVAESLGFSRKNLIAVDVDASCINAQRAAGVMAVHTHIGHAVIAFPPAWELHGLLLDYCCGVTNDVMTMAMMLACGFRVNGGIVVNLQRGRDASCDPQAKATRLFGSKNRAAWFMEMACSGQLHSNAIVQQKARRHSSAAFLSYRSSVVKMDSCAFTITPKIRQTLQQLESKGIAHLPSGPIFDMMKRTGRGVNDSKTMDVSRKIIAARAVASRSREAV